MIFPRLETNRCDPILRPGLKRRYTASRLTVRSFRNSSEVQSVNKSVMGAGLGTRRGSGPSICSLNRV